MTVEEIVREDIDKIRACAEEALRVMKKRDIIPNPDNFTLWYNYVMGEDPSLIAEVDQIYKQNVAFSEEVNEYLRDKYIDSHAAQVPEGVGDSKTMLSQLLQEIGSFRGKADAHNKRLGTQTNKLSEHIEKAGVQDLLGEIVSQLSEIHESGVDFSAKLAESQKELQEMRKSLHEAENESRRDFLTGIYNRRALDEFLIDKVAESERSLKDLSVLMIDIDHFKPFNDKWGHQIGDEVLKVVAQALTKSVKGQDVVARYGGEEFSVVLPDTPINGARIVAENIRKTIAKSKLTMKDGQDIGQITVSIGAARLRVGEGDTIPYLIKRADEALYAAKEAGRNRVIAEM